MRNRLKTAASGRGQTVQSLVRGLVERFFVEEARTPPWLGAVVVRLQCHAASLGERGIAALRIFGSVARGNACPDSDSDLMVDIDPAKPVSLVGLASLRAE
jgi:hypothetical protein